jgi:non-ribosomal peptide synthetase component F
LRAGGAYVPVEPSYPPERISFMIRDSGATIVLVDKTSAAGLSLLHHDDAGVMPNVVVMDDILDAESLFLSDDGPNHSRANRLAARGKCDGSSLAYVIYTSGTTGRPKGVLVEHRGLVNDIVHVRDSMLTAADFSRA